MPVCAVSWVPPPTMPRVPQTMGRWANSPCGPGVYAQDWVVMYVFLWYARRGALQSSTQQATSYLKRHCKAFFQRCIDMVAHTI